MPDAESNSPPSLTRGRILFIMSSLLLSTVMASLGSSFVPIAVPDMIDDLDSSTAEVVWVALGYLIAASGSSLYDTHCLACHGPDARGIQGLGADLAESKLVASNSPDAVVEFLKVGRLADDSASLSGLPMPGFAWVPEADLHSIVEYLQGL